MSSKQPKELKETLREKIKILEAIKPDGYEIVKQYEKEVKQLKGPDDVRCYLFQDCTLALLARYFLGEISDGEFDEAYSIFTEYFENSFPSFSDYLQEHRKITYEAKKEISKIKKEQLNRT